MDSDQSQSELKRSQKNKIFKYSEPIPHDVVDILKVKSSIVDAADDQEKLKFSKYIRKAYIDILDAFNGRTKVVMEIIANVPDVKIIYLPNEDNIDQYEKKKHSQIILEGITYARSEAIIVAAKGYDKEKSYRKFLGVIIHEFYHFAIHETFGNGFKPYYADDDVAAEEWKELVEQYKSSDLNEFPLIKELYIDYKDETKWVDELVVRYPQIFVQHHGSEYLHMVESKLNGLYSIFVTKVHVELTKEKEKIASLRSVNKRSLLGDNESKLYVNLLETRKSIRFDAHRQIVKTNQTYLVMKNIFNQIQSSDDFKSRSMFVGVKFLEDGDNMKDIEKAMQCRKETF